MGLKLDGDATKEQLEKVAGDPHTSIGAHITDADGGTVKATATSEGSWWSLTAWVQWARRGGKSAGADVDVKF